LQNNQPDFLNNSLDWTVNRRDRTFRVYVVEPSAYEPKNHARIFEAAINVFIKRQPTPIDPYTQVSDAAEAAQHFDLVTFPEAFLPADRLLEILNHVGHLDNFGAVHVGLRPSGTDLNHLFLTDKLHALLHALKTVPRIVPEDLNAFSVWLRDQQKDMRFNVGCLFTVDAEQRVRVCLHPKLVQSKYEVSPLQEANMEEANLLTVVTLRPTDKRSKTVIVQPLLCSDALHLTTKRGGSRPLEAFQRDASCLGANPPDHIDVVSVATCTPQIQEVSYRTWHKEFRDTFERAAKDDSLARHHFATFVLSNFLMIATDKPGGLSGAFIPVPVGHAEFPDYVTLSCWGRPQNSVDNRWSTPDEDCVGNWSTRGYIASLNPFEKAGAIARMFGFTIDRLPRDQSPWSERRGLTGCTLRIGEDQGTTPSLVFA
jgi:hypothetical protein